MCLQFYCINHSCQNYFVKTTECFLQCKSILRLQVPNITKYQDYIQGLLFTESVLVKGIVHFEIKMWYLSAYPKGIQDVGVFFSSVDPILIFLGQTVLVCQSYNGVWRVCARSGLVCARDHFRRFPALAQTKPERAHTHTHTHTRHTHTHTRHTPDVCAHSDHLDMVVYKR